MDLSVIPESWERSKLTPFGVLIMTGSLFKDFLWCSFDFIEVSKVGIRLISLSTVILVCLLQLILLESSSYLLFISPRVEYFINIIVIIWNPIMWLVDSIKHKSSKKLNSKLYFICDLALDFLPRFLFS